jgi:hypothetical protein
MDCRELESNLKCPICLNFAKNPYESSCCGHIFCHKCKDKVYPRICPICRDSNFEFRKNFLAEQMLKKVEINCHYGCEKKVVINNMGSHRYNCDTIIFTCKFPECKWDGLKPDFMKHLKDEHSEHLIAMTENFGKFSKKIKMITKDGIVDLHSRLKKLPEEKKEVSPLRFRKHLY